MQTQLKVRKDRWLDIRLIFNLINQKRQRAFQSSHYVEWIAKCYSISTNKIKTLIWNLFKEMPRALMLAAIHSVHQKVLNQFFIF